MDDREPNLLLLPFDSEKKRRDPLGWISAMAAYAERLPGSGKLLAWFLAEPPKSVRFTNPLPEITTIYFIASEAGPIKIGMARDVQMRLRDLQNAGPSRLHVAATVQGRPSLEREYHRRFSNSRLHGEWFSPAPEILTEIDRLKAEGAA